VLYFDGVCNLCNASVQWIIRRDKKEQFLFAPLQSERGEAAQKEAGQKLDSIILQHEGKLMTRSDAALKIAGLLGAPWSWLTMLRIFPAGLRNTVYDWIARNRYRWFGKKDACMLPTPALRSRFLIDASVNAENAV
jgi:predicted DCC family thiol-disulfide oxidoreductase YuxK